VSDVDDYGEDDGGYVQEEPDCFGCNDAGGRCRDCNPSWWQHQRFVWRWRLSGLIDWPGRRRRLVAGVFDDEPPF
jgi:hypothetical protein